MAILRNLGGNFLQDATVKAGKEAFSVSKKVVLNSNEKVRIRNISDLFFKTSGLNDFREVGMELKEFFDETKEKFGKKKESSQPSIKKSKKNIASRILGIPSKKDSFVQDFESMNNSLTKMYDLLKEHIPSLDDIQTVMKDSFMNLNSSFSKMQESLSKLLFFTENSATKAAQTRAEVARTKLVENENIIETRIFNTEVLETLEKLVPSSELVQSSEKENDSFDVNGSDLLALAFGGTIFKQFISSFKGFLSTSKGVLSWFGTFISKIPILGVALVGISKAFTGLFGVIKSLGFVLRKFLALPLIALQLWNEVQDSEKTQKKFKNKGSFLGMDTSNFNAGVGNFLGGSKKKGEGSIVGGAAQGALTGAAIGSIIPGIGTGIGAVVGGIIGAISTYFGGKEIADMLGRFQASISEPLEDFALLMRDCWNYVTSIPEKLVMWFQETMSSLRKSIYNLADYLVDKYFDFTDFFSGFREMVSDKFVEIKDTVLNMFTDIDFSSIVSTFVDSISDIFTKIKESMKYFVFDMLDSLGTIGKKTQKLLFTEEEIKQFSKTPKEEILNKKEISPITVKGSKEEIKQVLNNIQNYMVKTYEQAEKKHQEMTKSSKPVIIQQPSRNSSNSASQNQSAPLLVAPRPIRNMNYSSGSMKFVN